MLLSEWQILGIALSSAFAFVEYRPRIVLFERKPFNCIKCMTGWFALVAAICSGYGWYSLLFLPVGVFIGAMFEGIKMRWL